MTYFFTSDTHFHHPNIIKYCKRPFDSVEWMNQKLIEYWNNTVGPDDIVYHLGDFGFGSLEEHDAIMEKLNCKEFYLVKGNHDKLFGKHPKANFTDSMDKRIRWIKDYHELTIPDEEMDCVQKIILMHYPIQEWNHKRHGSWHLHGHEHGAPLANNPASRLDVGIDCHNYCPISYEQVKEIITKRVLLPKE